MLEQGCCIFIIVPLFLRSFTPHLDAFLCRASTNLCLCGFSVLFLCFFLCNLSLFHKTAWLLIKAGVEVDFVMVFCEVLLHREQHIVV